MGRMFRKAFAALLLTLAATSAQAGPCDFRLSQLIGPAPAAGAIAAGGVTAAGGAAMSAAGLYVIVHSTSGLTMLGSTMAGASAAGTVGIIGGTAGAIGTVGSVLMAPVTILAAGTAAIAASGIEAVCFFQDERITEYEEVLNLVQVLAAQLPGEVFRVTVPESSRNLAFISIDMDGEAPLEEFDVARLYVVNGRLMHRDWGRNTPILDIALATPETLDAEPH